MRAVALFFVAGCGEETVHWMWPRFDGARSAIVGYEDQGAHLFAANLDGFLELELELPKDRDEVELFAKVYEESLADLDLRRGPIALAEEGVPSRNLPASTHRYQNRIGIDRQAHEWTATETTPVLDAARIAAKAGPVCFEVGQSDITSDLSIIASVSFAVPVSGGLLLGDILGDLYYLSKEGLTPAPTQPARFKAGAAGANGDAYFGSGNELWRGRPTPLGVLDAVRVSTASMEIGHVVIGSQTYVADVFGGVSILTGDRLVEVARVGDVIRELEILASGRLIALTQGRRILEIDPSGGLREISIDEAADFPQTIYVDSTDRLLVGTTEGSILWHRDPGFVALYPEPFAFTILDMVDVDSTLLFGIASGFAGQLVGGELCEIFQVTLVLDQLRLVVTDRSIYGFGRRDDEITRIDYRLDLP